MPVLAVDAEKKTPAAAEVFLDVRSILAFYATTSNSAWSAASESEPTHKSKTATS